MARITVEAAGDEVTITFHGLEAVWVLQHRVTLPVAAIAGVCVARRSDVPETGLRLPGTAWPGVIRAGSYGVGAERDLWDVRNGEQVLVLQLHPGGPYRRVVLEVDDPREIALRLRPVVGAWTGPFV